MKARIVVRQRANGKTGVFIDGQPVPGLFDFHIDKGDRFPTLTLSIIGPGFKLEQEPEQIIEAGQ